MQKLTSILWIVTCSVLATTASAQEQEKNETSELAAPAEPSPFTFHGYASIAYADATESQIFGVPKGGTFDYRTMAFQMRYAVNSNHGAVVQLSHESLADSVLSDSRDAIELDWAFYQYQFDNAGLLRAGRVPIPKGFYNEIRDVGTLLPFYRPPSGFYFEGAFTSESVDGVAYSQSFYEMSSWSIDADGYFGWWDWKEFDDATSSVQEANVKNGLGGQFWLNTPIDGLRVGAGGVRYSLKNSILGSGSELDVKEWHASVDGDFEHFLGRSELRRVSFEPGHYFTYYVQLGVKPTSKLGVYYQYSGADLRFSAPFLPTFDNDFNDDHAVAVNYRFLNRFVAKVENHWFTGFSVEDGAADIFFAPPMETNYFIASLSFAF